MNRRLYLALLLLGLLLLTAATDNTSPKPLESVAVSLSGATNLRQPEYDAAQNYAVLIGINDYEYAGDLRWAERDVDRMRQVLVEHCGYKSDNIIIRKGREADQRSIILLLADLANENLYPNAGTLLFFYSGHGTQIAGENYLVPQDGDPDPRLAEMRNIPMKSMLEALENSVFKRKVVLLDACRNNLSPDKAVSAENSFKPLAAVPANTGTAPDQSSGLHIIYSTQKDQFSIEDHNLQSGLFTRFVVDGLTGAAAKDGRITSISLYDYLLEQMRNYSRQTAESQLPVSSATELLGEIVLAIPDASQPGQQTELLDMPEVQPQVPPSQVTPAPAVETPSVPVVATPWRHGPRQAASVAQGGTIYGLWASPDGDCALSTSGGKQALLTAVPGGQRVLEVSLRDRVVEAVWSSTGKYAVVWGYDSQAALVDAVDEEIVAFISHGKRVTTAAFSPGGRYLATGSKDENVRLTKCATGEEVDTFTGHHGDIWTLAFSPDGEHLASGSEDGTMRIIRTDGMREVARLEFDEGVREVVFAPDGKSVAGRSWATLKLMEVPSGREIARVRHGDFIYAMEYSPNGRYLASGGQDAVLRLVDTASGQEIALVTFSGRVAEVAFSPDGRLLAGRSGEQGSPNGMAKLIAVPDGRELAVMPFAAHATALAFSASGQYLAAGSADGSVQLVDTASGAVLANNSLGETVWGLAFSADGGCLAVEVARQPGSLRSAQTGDCVKLLAVPTGTLLGVAEHAVSISTMAFSPDGAYLLSGTCDGQVLVWEPAR